MKEIPTLSLACSFPKSSSKILYLPARNSNQVSTSRSHDHRAVRLQAGGKTSAQKKTANSSRLSPTSAQACLFGNFPHHQNFSCIINVCIRKIHTNVVPGYIKRVMLVMIIDRNRKKISNQVRMLSLGSRLSSEREL